MLTNACNAKGVGDKPYKEKLTKRRRENFEY
jgi:hypothetical protein